MAFSTSVVGAPNDLAARSAEVDAPAAAALNDLAARSSELDARAVENLEARAAALVCQFGGVKACSVKVWPFPGL